MHFPLEAPQKRLSKAQFLHLAKEAEVEANKRRWSVISERYLRALSPSSQVGLRSIPLSAVSVS